LGSVFLPGVLLGYEQERGRGGRRLGGSCAAAREGVGPGCELQKGGRGGSVRAWADWAACERAGGGERRPGGGRGRLGLGRIQGAVPFSFLFLFSFSILFSKGVFE